MPHVVTTTGARGTGTASGRSGLSHIAAAGALLPFLVLLGAALRLLYLDRQSLWFDEGVGLIFSGCDAVSGCLEAMLNTRTSERFQFLYPLLLHEWRVLFGSSESALRSLSVVFGVAAIVLVGLTARRVFGHVHAGWSLAFMALSGFTLVHAQEARPYTFFLLIAAAQIWLYMLSRQGSRGGRLGLYAVMALASWAGVFPLLFSVAIALADLADRRFRIDQIGRWLLWWLPAGIVCLPAVLYYGQAAMGTTPDEILVPRSQQPLLNLAFLVYGQFVGQTFGPSVEALRGPGRYQALIANSPLLLAFALVLGLGALHGLRMWRRRSSPAPGEVRVLALVAASYCGLLLVFVLLTNHNLLPRHAIALHVPIALLLPCLAARSRLGQMLVAALLALNMISVARHYFDPAQWKDDYRSAAAYVRESGEPKRPVLLLRGLSVLFAYYGYEGMTVVLDPPQSKVPGIAAAAMDDRGELVIVVNRETDLWPEGWLETALAPALHLSRRQEFHYFSIYTFTRR